MTDYAFLDSQCGAFPTKIVEAGVNFCKAINEMARNNQKSIEESTMKINSLEKRMALYEQTNAIVAMNLKELGLLPPTANDVKKGCRGRRKDRLLASHVDEEKLVRTVKEFLRGKRIDNEAVDLIKYKVPTSRFALFLYQILDRHGLIAHGEHPQMRYSAYARFLQKCTGLDYCPARCNYMRIKNCYETFLHAGKEIKLYELEEGQVPPGFRYKAEVPELKKQYDYMEAQLSRVAGFSNIARKKFFEVK